MSCSNSRQILVVTLLVLASNVPADRRMGWKIHTWTPFRSLVRQLAKYLLLPWWMLHRARLRLMTATVWMDMCRRKCNAVKSTPSLRCFQLCVVSCDMCWLSSSLPSASHFKTACYLASTRNIVEINQRTHSRFLCFTYAGPCRFVRLTCYMCVFNTQVGSRHISSELSESKQVSM